MPKVKRKSAGTHARKSRSYERQRATGKNEDQGSSEALVTLTRASADKEVRKISFKGFCLQSIITVAPVI